MSNINIPQWSLIPFILQLLIIALAPFLFPHFWEKNRNKLILGLLLSAPVILFLYQNFGSEASHLIGEKISEYLSFVAILFPLYLISSGIYIQGSLSGTPLMNTFLLGLGGLLASFIGTTGASVLLIRPLLRASQARKNRSHLVIFFIFIVSNCGGLLTPMGDPPLFLGFLLGVPFLWTLALWKQWLLVVGSLLIIFNFYDSYVFNKEEAQRKASQLEAVMKHEPLKILGSYNFILFGLLILLIYFSGIGFANGGKRWPFGVQEFLIVFLGLLSYKFTAASIHKKNHFSLDPVLEVCALFLGIFITMIPALLFLNTNAKVLGIESPRQYFWFTGLLSAFLDNAPTYLSFTAMAAGSHGINAQGQYLSKLIPLAPQTLMAISAGAVFFGAATYIGNGPNFLVKAIAEKQGVKMPGFLGYMIYTAFILLPILILCSVLFF